MPTFWCWNNDNVPRKINYRQSRKNGGGGGAGTRARGAKTRKIWAGLAGRIPQAVGISLAAAAALTRKLQREGLRLGRHRANHGRAQSPHFLGGLQIP